MIKLSELLREVYEQEDITIPSKNKNGKCYQVAVDYMYQHPRATLCHGLVTGQGAIRGTTYNHAWVEDGNTVIDKTVDIKIPKLAYYALGQIKESNVYRYTFKEMQENLLKTKTYGP